MVKLSAEEYLLSLFEVAELQSFFQNLIACAANFYPMLLVLVDRLLKLMILIL